MTDLTPNPDAPGDEAELADLRSLARRIEPGPVAWETPPPDLWGKIAAAAGVPAGAAEEQPADGGTAPGNVRRLDGARRAGGRGAAGRRRVVMTWGVAAAAVAVLVVGVGAVLRDRGSEDSTIVAAAALERLGESGEGRAELVDHDGSLQLRLSTSGLDPGDGFLEVWVINTEVTQLVSLGPLRGDGVYELPAGLDPAAFPIVDVSVEPIDGNPTHSGDSVLRGRLTL